MGSVSKNFYFLLYILAVTGVVAYRPFIDSDLAVFVFVLTGWMASVAVHEWAHALTAWKGGDRTMPAKGYLTLDPLHYADPINSIFFPLLFTILGGIGLPGGAVYIERHLIRTRVGQAIVSAAGPLANLAILALLSLPFALGLDRSGGSALFWSGVGLLAFFQATAIVLNLLPIPGFDGFGIIEPFLPRAVQIRAAEMRNVLVIGVIALLLLVPATSHFITGLAVRLTVTFGIGIDWIAIGIQKFRFWHSLGM